MNIGVTSQNFRAITGHAGKARRFIVYAVEAPGVVREIQRLDLPKAMSLHEYHGDDHPVFALDVVITASCGEGLRTRLHAHGVQVLTTSATEPLDAVQRYSRNEELPPASPHDHGHDSETVSVFASAKLGKRN